MIPTINKVRRNWFSHTLLGHGMGTPVLQGNLTVCTNIASADGFWFIILEIYPREIIGQVHDDECITMLILALLMQATILKHLQMYQISKFYILNLVLYVNYIPIKNPEAI